MPRVRLAAVPLLAGLIPLTAGALGLGEITLRSALNQPFVAEIPVTADSAEELNQLSVQLAPAAAFERFGLDRPRFLDDLAFNVQREGTRAVVRVTSTQPVSEPFISLLLDVGWPQGRLLREYTVLLDPPAFAGAEPAARGAPPAPAAAAGPAPAAPAIRREPAPAPAAAAPAAPVVATGSVTGGPDGNVYGPVRSNETLWAISDRLRGEANVSLNQMMVALYRANPEAFAGNINRLRRGAILRIPDAAALAAVSGREAASEVQRQDAEWRGSPGAEPSSPAPARLELVPPSESAAGAGTGSTATADAAALQRELAEKQRLLDLRNQELKALQDRVSQLEGRGAAAEAPVAAPAPPPSEAPAGPADVAGGLPPEAAAEAPPPVAATAEPAAEERKPARRPAAQERQRESGGGILDSLGAVVFNVWFLVSAAVVLLAGLFLIFARRRMAEADAGAGRFGNEFRGGSAPGASSTQPLVRRDGYSVEEGAADRTQVAAPARGREADEAETPLERTISTEGAVELDQADVVAEADFHMAYGLYDQAAELLTRALRDNPDRRDLRLKLLEVYFIWENKAAFLREAQIFHRQLQGQADPDWNKVVIMGKQICPGEALFAGAVGAVSDVGLDLGAADDQGGVDIAFDEGEADSLDLDLTAARQGPSSDLLDFDLGTGDDQAAADGSLDDTSMMRTQVAPRGGTVEGPTIEAPYAGDYSPTMETPTIESRGLGAVEAPTIETPTVETPAGGTLETPTLESAVPGMKAGSEARRQGGDQTEEINLEDLGLDLTGLDEAAGELGTGVHDALPDAAAGADDELVFDIGSPDEDDGSDLLQGLETDSTAEMRGMGMALDEGTLDLPAFGNAMEKSAAGRNAPRDSGGDTAEHRAVEDTAEQPRVASTGLSEASAELSQVDFDVGAEDEEDLEPTSVLTGRRRGPEGPTMTEVGTKLDLARAYVDMGDPDGARSILNEVLEEGDSAQRQEARRLLDELTD